MIEVRRRSRRYTSGHCKPWKWATTITFGSESDPASVIEVVAHEVCHLPNQPKNAGGREELHGPGYRLLLRKAIQEVWGVAVEDTGSPMWELDKKLEEALRLQFNTPERSTA